MQSRSDSRPSPRARATPQSEPLSAAAAAAATEASRDAAVHAGSPNGTSAPLDCIRLCPSTSMRRTASVGAEPPAAAGAVARTPRPASSSVVTASTAAMLSPTSYLRRSAAAWTDSAAAAAAPDANSSHALSWPSADKDWWVTILRTVRAVALYICMPRRAPKRANARRASNAHATRADSTARVF
uniref:Uncharacterized protein n=1 Tax=Chlamydomonas euryale TaxID=1486919 RepID=A0A7R9YVY7_9CHLO|eukprot:93307-Chlamydomonas_euryale.AAC.2